MTLNAKLYGLILSGGKSSRMGSDKGLIEYHGVPQRTYLYNLLQQVCDEAFISLRKDQVLDLPPNMKAIVDLNEYKGPYNGLLSAHKQYPQVAWLVLACDLPLINLAALQELVLARNKSKMATAFALKENPLPEPLCAIWEASALNNSISYLKSGAGSCPRKFLINNETELVFSAHDHVLLNANSKDEYQEALKRLA